MAGGKARGVHAREVGDEVGPRALEHQLQAVAQEQPAEGGHHAPAPARGTGGARARNTATATVNRISTALLPSAVRSRSDALEPRRPGQAARIRCVAERSASPSRRSRGSRLRGPRPATIDEDPHRRDGQEACADQEHGVAFGQAGHRPPAGGGRRFAARRIRSRSMSGELRPPDCAGQTGLAIGRGEDNERMEALRWALVASGPLARQRHRAQPQPPPALVRPGLGLPARAHRRPLPGLRRRLPRAVLRRSAGRRSRCSPAWAR